MMQDIFDRLLELFKEMSDDDIDVSGITMQSRLVEDIGFSSFNLIWMAFAIHREFNIDMEKMQCWKPETVGDICETIKNETK